MTGEPLTMSPERERFLRDVAQPGMPCTIKDVFAWIAEVDALRAALAAAEAERFEPYCEDSGQLALNGACPLHDGDACLRVRLDPARSLAPRPAPTGTEGNK